MNCKVTDNLSLEYAPEKRHNRVVRGLNSKFNAHEFAFEVILVAGQRNLRLLKSLSVHGVQSVRCTFCK